MLPLALDRYHHSWMTNELQQLFRAHFGVLPEIVLPVKVQAARHKIFRLRRGEHSAIGVVDAVPAEARAFVGFSRHFFSKGLPVPEIYGADVNAGTYLEEDLGSTSLIEHLIADRAAHPGVAVPPASLALYREALEALCALQVEGHAGLDYSLCFQPNRFDATTVVGDAQLFEQEFLRRTPLTWDRTQLFRDVAKLCELMQQGATSFFLHRDFQGRNIIIRTAPKHGYRIGIIDYQTGRQGPLHYDLVSLVFQSRAELPAPVRQELVNFYLETMSKRLPLDRQQFLTLLPTFVFARLLNILGRYAELGLGEGREYFRQLLPFGVRNARSIADTMPLPFHAPELTRLFRELDTLLTTSGGTFSPPPLTVTVRSFSYKHGLPPGEKLLDGFVFDCRYIPNPGREPRFKEATGLDPEVGEFIRQSSEGTAFIAEVTAMVERAVTVSKKKGVASLGISFGCTGGQHRSVYLAEVIAGHLRAASGVQVVTEHLQLRQLFPERFR